MSKPIVTGSVILLLSASAAAQVPPAPPDAPVAPGAAPAPVPVPPAAPAPPAPPAEPSPAPSADAEATTKAEPDVGKGVAQGTKAAAAEEQQAAEASPLSGFRGGTLGFPGDGASGVVAAAKIQTHGEPFDAAILARAGSLDILTLGSVRLSVDVLAEQVQLDVPFSEFPVGQAPNPQLVSKGLSSLGFRLRLSNVRTNNLATKKQLYEQRVRRDISACASLWKNKVVIADPALKAQCDQAKVTFEAAISPEDQSLDPDKVESIVATEVLEFENAHLHGWSLTPGVRFLYRKADDTGRNAGGIAGELSVQYSHRVGAVFLSGSVVAMDEAVDFNANDPKSVATVQEALVEGKGTLGFYFQGPRGAGVLAPRFGAYYSFFRNKWENRFATEKMDANVKGYQHEAAVFFSGTFSNGVSGLFSFGVRRPYGHDPNLEYIFGFSPAFGSQVGEKKEAGAQ